VTESRTAVVTGGAQGIGAAIAQRLAADGHKVAVVDLSADAAQATVDAIVATGGEAVAVGADVSDVAAVDAAFAQIVDALGAPTILVNNAGIIRDNLLFKMTVDEWDLVMAVHLRGAFLMAKAVQKHMIEAGFGRIINLSSISAYGNRGQANYSAAKAGVHGFTKTLALELGKFGVTANAIGPGFIETPMTASTAERLGVPFDQFIEAVAKETPVGRVGQPDDIAHAVSFFASEGAGYVTGQVLNVSGGVHG
jgi:3-oxoacyl-[acyl-carrier protein] reductase